MLSVIESLDNRARLHRTACGDDALVWREWGQGETVVLCHGGFGSWLHWVRNIEFLAEHYRVLGVDLPGLGDSAPPPLPHNPASVASPVVDGLLQLLPARGACHLVGFSFGGLIAGHVAASLGDRARSLTLVGASGLGMPRERTELIARTPDMDAQAIRDAQAQNLRLLMFHDADQIDDLALAVQAHNDERARIKSRRMSMSDALRQALAHVSASLNGIWGEHDVTAKPRLDQYQSLLKSFDPALEFQIIPNAGHWVQYEASNLFNATLHRMLGRFD